MIKRNKIKRALAEQVCYNRNEKEEYSSFILIVFNEFRKFLRHQIILLLLHYIIRFKVKIIYIYVWSIAWEENFFVVKFLEVNSYNFKIKTKRK